MIPKVSTVFLRENQTVRQGWEVMHRHGYTAIPVVDGEGRYVGTVSEGDFLNFVMAAGTTDTQHMEHHRVTELVRKDFCPSLQIDADREQVIAFILEQNFVPIVDSRGALCGILTRRGVIQYLAEAAQQEGPGGGGGLPFAHRRGGDAPGPRRPAPGSVPAPAAAAESVFPYSHVSYANPLLFSSGERASRRVLGPTVMVPHRGGARNGADVEGAGQFFNRRSTCLQGPQPVRGGVEEARLGRHAPDAEELLHGDEGVALPWSRSTISRAASTLVG